MIKASRISVGRMPGRKQARQKRLISASSFLIFTLSDIFCILAFHESSIDLRLQETGRFAPGGYPFLNRIPASGSESKSRFTFFT